MEAKLKSALNLSFVKSTGITGGGCINEGFAYETENGLIFVKQNSKAGAMEMFEGELRSLNAISSTNTVRVPKPIKVIKHGSGAVLVMEYIKMSSLRTHARLLGQQLARLHLHNENLLKKDTQSIHNKEDEDIVSCKPVEQFGFDTTTCCGAISQDNTWNGDWVEFYARQKLHKQFQMVETEYGDREARELWSELKLKLPSFFTGIVIEPSLLHGDLWSGNASETDQGPVIFDPASFYGHSEYELSIAEMFGGFPSAFYSAYHELIPKQIGFDTRRDLYKLFHCLNHWNHFGGGYRSSTISIMKRLLKI